MCNKNKEIKDIKSFLFYVITLYGESILRHPKDKIDLENFNKIMMKIRLPDDKEILSMIDSKNYNVINSEIINKLKSVTNKIINKYYN